MSAEDEQGEGQGEPVTFDEVVDATTPRLRPGVSKQDFLESLRNAVRTGGHVPGQAAPDISMPVVTDLSGSGIRPEVMKALAAGGSLEDVGAALAGGLNDVTEPGIPAALTSNGTQRICDGCGSSQWIVRSLHAYPYCANCGSPSFHMEPLPPAGPADPFGQGHVAGIGLAEMYNDMLAGGIPLASVERILGAMLAAYAHMDQADG